MSTSSGTSGMQSFADGRPAEHFDAEGDLIIQEEDGDDLKILGIFSTQARADRRIELARSEPGFRDEPDCFYVSTYELDRHLWLDGFISLEPPDPGPSD